MAVATCVFVPALASLGEIVPHDGVLTPEELERVALGVRDSPALWQPLVRVDPEQRRYELLFEDDRLEVWVNSWMEGHATGFHDHFTSSVGLCIAQGAVREDHLRIGETSLMLKLTAGMSRRGSPMYIHRVQHLEGAPAVTIHAYSPRLDWVGQYRVGPDGTLGREIEPGRNELRDQLVATGALDGVLERY